MTEALVSTVSAVTKLKGTIRWSYDNHGKGWSPESAPADHALEREDHYHVECTYRSHNRQYAVKIPLDGNDGSFTSTEIGNNRALPEPSGRIEDVLIQKTKNETVITGIWIEARYECHVTIILRKA